MERRDRRGKMRAVGTAMIVFGRRLTPEHVRLRLRLGRIDQTAVGPRARRFGHVCFLDLARSKNMKDALAGRQEIVGNDTSMTTPPHALRAHDRASPRVPEFAKMRESFTKIVA